MSVFLNPQGEGGARSEPDDLVVRLDQQATLLQKHGQYFIGTLLDEAAAEIRSLREQVAKMEEALIEHNCGDPTCICVACINKRDVIEAQQDKEPT